MHFNNDLIIFDEQLGLEDGLMDDADREAFIRTQAERIRQDEDNWPASPDA